jgi:predicted dehydrogenase
VSVRDGATYAPTAATANRVCEPGEFTVAAVGLDHGHIYGMCNGLLEAGARLRWVYDPDPAKVAAFLDRYPDAEAATSEQQALDDPEVQLVASAAIPVDRADLGLRVLDHGKHYFTDKPPMTTLDQLARARAATSATGRKYAVYYSERLHTESGVYAGQLVADGAIGRVIQVMGMGPHRMNPAGRPGWFFDRDSYGGILCDIGSHQLEQVLFYGGTDDATITSARVANYAHKDHPGLEDFGDVNVALANGVTGYCRVDWFTPDALGTWGDGRTFILGTDGYLELRKYTDIARDQEGDHVYLVNGSAERHIPVHGKVGYPFFGQLIRDCLDGTENAMTQSHAFAAAELCLRAQQQATRVELLAQRRQQQRRVLLEHPDLGHRAVGEREQLDHVDGGRTSGRPSRPGLRRHLHGRVRPASHDPRVGDRPGPVPSERRPHRGHPVQPVVPPAVRQRGRLLDPDLGVQQRRRPGPVARREPARELGHDLRAAAVAHYRFRRVGSIVGKNPLTVPALISVMARSRSNFLPCLLSSASCSAIPITARAAMSGDSNGNPYRFSTSRQASASRSIATEKFSL